jgi:receptor protein-tyrosine kinase
LAAAGIFLAAQQSVYRASMKIVVGQGGGIFQPANSGSVDPLTQTMTNLLESDVVARAVIRNLNLSLQPPDLLKHLAVSTRPQTAVLAVRYDSTDKAEAVAILRETGTVFARLVSRLGAAASPKATGSAATVPVSARMFDPAHLEPGRSSPRRLDTLLIAGALATFLGVAVAFARESLTPRIDSREQAEEWFGAPVLATLPKGSLESPPLGLSGRSRRSKRIARALAFLLARLQTNQGGGGAVLVATSGDDDEQKSMVVAHLGAALAATGEEVICVEADTEAPRVSRHLGVETNSNDAGSYGLVDVVAGRVEPEGALHPVRAAATVGGVSSTGGRQRATARLRLLPAGGPRSGEAGALNTERLVSLTKTLASGARYLIVDAPPVLLSAHTLPLAMASDAILVVAELGSTTKTEAEAVQRILGTIEHPAVYVVLCQPASTRRRLWSRLQAARQAQTKRAPKITQTKTAPKISRTAPVKTEPPKARPPKAEPPKAEPPKAEPPKAEPPKAEPPKAEPPKAEPPKAEPLTESPRSEAARSRAPARKTPSRSRPPRRQT